MHRTYTLAHVLSLLYVDSYIIPERGKQNCVWSDLVALGSGGEYANIAVVIEL